MPPRRPSSVMNSRRRRGAHFARYPRAKADHALACDPPMTPVDGLRFCRGACCVSDKLADLFPKARRFKWGDLSAIHPQQGCLLRTDHILRGALGCVSSVRHGAPRPPCPLRVREALWSDRQRRPSEAEFFALGNDSTYPLTCCPQHPCAHLGSCVRAGKRLNQPVRDARRDATRLV